MSADTPSRRLHDATLAIAATGGGLMRMVLPDDRPAERWLHYPADDAVDPVGGARWFYHSHDAEGPDSAEHGHFHLFLPRRAMPRSVPPLIAPPAARRPRPSIVHIAALSIDHDGLPSRWSATNRWVTSEWLYPAAAIAALLPTVTFGGAAALSPVSRWLAALVHASAPALARLLAERDRILIAQGLDGEDRAIEIVASTPVDLDALLD